MNLEDELRRALRPEQPPAGFGQRVSEKIASTRRRPSALVPSRLPGRLAAAALIALMTGSSLYYTHRRQVSEAERVRNEAVVGLRIASAKLNEVHEKLLQRITSQNERSR